MFFGGQEHSWLTSPPDPLTFWVCEIPKKKPGWIALLHRGASTLSVEMMTLEAIQ